MAELVYAQALGACEAIHVGSSPTVCTKQDGFPRRRRDAARADPLAVKGRRSGQISPSAPSDKIMENRTQLFVEELVRDQKDKIISVEVLGSGVGEKDLAISDIDLLIICPGKRDTKKVFAAAVRAQEKIFGIHPTRLNAFIQRIFLASNSFGGIHLIVIGRDELNESFQPVSFRLRLMTKLVGRNLFLFEIKKNHRLLYGHDFSREIKVGRPGFSEKLACFLLPATVLLSALPAVILQRQAGKIWCFKAINYFNTGSCSLAAIEGRQADAEGEMVKTAKCYRYQPDEYRQNIFWLYCQVWREIFGQLPFLFRRNGHNN